MPRNGKVVVAMSGGVDSSVAAYMLREQGYDCVGVFLRVGVEQPEPEPTCDLSVSGVAVGRTRTGIGVESGSLHDSRPVTAMSERRLKHGCCSANDAVDARAVAGRLGIPFYALNFEKEFGRIIDYFVDEYARARTPNPCVMCNIQIKFGRLLQYAKMMDAEFVATGHYARVIEHDGRLRLARSLNQAKDQSYVLYGIRADDVRRCLFPLGEIAEKSEVRRIAAELGLAVHDKPDSQEICFVPSNDYARLVHERRPETRVSGEIRDSEGNVLGTHEGVASYTVGQRRGLRLAMGHPIYVTHLDAETNTVTVGRRDALLADGLIADGVNWHVAERPTEWVPAEIKIRHMHTPARGRVRAAGDCSIEAVFDEPQPAVTPGQAAVAYDERGLVIVGGWIREALATQ